MEEYKKDDRGRSKAKRLTEADPHTKVDSSTWTPPEALEADVKTGARPLVKRLYKKGGKVVGKHEGKDSHKHGGRMPRKTGGRTNKLTPDSLINRDVRTANEAREGEKHVGGFKKGGKAKHRADGGQTEAQRVGAAQSRSNKAYDNAWDTAGKWADFSPSGIGNKSNMDLSMDAAKAYMASRDADTAKSQAGMKKGGRAHKFGGGMMGNNPVSQQNQMMGKASGMMKKGGKVHKKARGGAEADYADRNYGADELSQMVNNMSSVEPMGTSYAKVPRPTARPADKPEVYTGPKPKTNPGPGLKKGGKISHPDEKADRQLIKSMIKPTAFKAKGGKAMHHDDCTCKMCWGGRTGKYSGGGIFSGDSKTKIPGDVGGRQAKKGGGESSSMYDDPNYWSGAHYDLFSGWQNLDKATPDQIAAMNSADRARAMEAQGNAPTRMGGMPGAGYGAGSRRSAPKPSPMAAGASDLSMMDPQQRAQANQGAGRYDPTQSPTWQAPPPRPQNTYMPGIRQGGAGEPAIVFGNPSGMENDPSSYAARERDFVQRQNQRLRDSMDAGINSDLTPRPGQSPMDTSEQSYGLTPEQEDALPRKSGGRAKGKTNVNIIIATGKGGQPQGMMGGQPMPNAPVSPRIPQQQPPMPQGGMPPQGMPPMPPQGGMPMPRKHGGRTGYPIDSGAGGGEARLEKKDAYGLKPARKAGGRTGYPIETGSGGGEARLDKVKAYGLTPPKRK